MGGIGGAPALGPRRARGGRPSSGYATDAALSPTEAGKGAKAPAVRARLRVFAPVAPTATNVATRRQGALPRGPGCNGITVFCLGLRQGEQQPDFVGRTTVAVDNQEHRTVAPALDHGKEPASFLRSDYGPAAQIEWHEMGNPTCQPNSLKNTPRRFAWKCSPL